MIKKLFKPVLMSMILIFTLMFGTVVSAAETTLKQSLIETSATSELEVAPDIAYINASITVTNESKDISFNTNKADVNKLVNTLIQAKILKADIVTTAFYANPYIDRILEDPKAAYPVYKEIKKYQTTTNLKITVRDISNVGDIIEKILSVDNINISNVSYTISNITKYKQEAIKGAVNSAKENINFSAEASGVKLDKLQSLSVDFYNNPYQPYPYPVYAKAMDGGVSAPLYQNPGNIKISATVRMSYSVK